MSSIASVKDRLKNRSRETGKTMQELLTIYGLERTIYRLSLSRFAENFILKGGIFLYAVYDKNYARATTDIDFLAQNISNGIDDMKNVFEEIFSVETDDPLIFDIDTLEVISITEFKKYHGVNVSITAYLDRTRIPVSIDVGYGDIIYPEKVEMDFPVLLSDVSPHVYAYSLSSSVAEKFEAIVSLAYDNSRFKDYYDLYVISTSMDFDGVEMTEAIKETFENRHTGFEDIVAFEEDFSDDPLRQSRWKSFVKKKKALIDVSLQETIEAVERFMKPLSDAIRIGEVVTGNWNHEHQAWE